LQDSHPTQSEQFEQLLFTCVSKVVLRDTPILI